MKKERFNNIDVFLLDNTEEKIYHTLKLGNRWGFGMGEQINMPTVLKAIEVYRTGKDYGFKAEIAPVLNGGINIFFHLNNNDDCLQISVYPDLEINMEYQRGLGQNYQSVYEKNNVHIPEIKKALKEIKESCNISGSYLFSFSTSYTRGSRATVLSTHQIMAEFPLSVATVSNRQSLPVFANISQNSIPKLQEYQ